MHIGMRNHRVQDATARATRQRHNHCMATASVNSAFFTVLHSMPPPALLATPALPDRPHHPAAASCCQSLLATPAPPDHPRHATAAHRRFLLSTPAPPDHAPHPAATRRRCLLFTPAPPDHPRHATAASSSRPRRPTTSITPSPLPDHHHHATAARPPIPPFHTRAVRPHSSRHRRPPADSSFSHPRRPATLTIPAAARRRFLFPPDLPLLFDSDLHSPLATPLRHPRHEPDTAAQTLLTTPSPSAAAPCLATPTPPQTIADTAARPLRIRSRPARLTVRHILPMPDTAPEPLRGSPRRGSAAGFMLSAPHSAGPVRSAARQRHPAPGVDCRGLPATIRDRLRRKAADGGSYL